MSSNNTGYAELEPSTVGTSSCHPRSRPEAQTHMQGYQKSWFGTKPTKSGEQQNKHLYLAENLTSLPSTGLANAAGVLCPRRDTCCEAGSQVRALPGNDNC